MIKLPIRPNNFALVSEEDYEKVKLYNWRVWVGKSGISYAVASSLITGEDIKLVYMHRIILGLTERWQIADHKDGNGLNNCRENLRPVTSSQNAWNTKKTQENKSSKFKGVTFLKRGKKRWQASIMHLGKVRTLGAYSNEMDAAKAYDKAAINLRKEFAKINFSS